MIFHASKSKLDLVRGEVMAAYSVGAVGLSFRFSPEWDGLTKTVMLSIDGKSWPVLLDETNACDIPAACFTHVGKILRVGVFGMDGTALIIPTVYATAGEIMAGSYVPGESPANPAPDVYQEIIGLMRETVNGGTVDAKGDLILRHKDGTTTEAGHVRGQSAYEYAQKGGYSGTEAEFSAWLAAVIDVTAQEEERVLAEAQRAANETGRVSAESIRVVAETGRETAEAVRTSAEVLRSDAETVRADAEVHRDEAEGDRREAELQRETSEGYRVAAESGRIGAESDRIVAEGARLENEFDRMQAEAARVAAEDVRIEAETERQTAEGERVARDAAAAEKIAAINAQLLILFTAYEQRTDSPKSWDNLIRAAAAVRLSSGNYEAINSFSESYDSGVTYNLMMDMGMTPISDFTAFRNSVVSAVGASINRGVYTLSWWQVQYHIINGNFNIGMAEAEAYGRANYWWYNFGAKISGEGGDLVKAVINAAQKASTQGISATLNTLTEDQMATIGMRMDFAGTPFPDIDSFKTAVTAAVKAAPTLVSAPENWVWDYLQYTIIRGNLLTLPARYESSGYYWWKDGGSPVPVDFSDEAPGAILKGIADAAYRNTFNGNDVAWSDFTLEMLDSARLVAADDGATTMAALPKFGSGSHSMDEFKDKASALMYALDASPLADPRLLKDRAGMTIWFFMQHYIIMEESLYAVSTFDMSIHDQASHRYFQLYWWYLLNDRPSNKPMVPASAYQLLVSTLLEEASGYEDPRVDIIIIASPYLLPALAFNVPWEPGVILDSLDVYFASGVAEVWGHIAFDAAFPDYGADITWYQLQHFFGNWYLDTPEAARDHVVESGYTAPAWVVEKWGE